MNATLSKSRLKRYLKSKHDLDLTYLIDKVSNWGELPIEFERTVSHTWINARINRYGPLYYLKGKQHNYLVQDTGGEWRGFSTTGVVPFKEIYEDVGIPEYLGMDPVELYEIFG